MKTFFISLAASAVLASSAHAGGVSHAPDLRAPTGQEAADAPRHPAFDGGRLDGDTLTETVLAVPVRFQGFHGIDLSAARLSPGDVRGLAADEASAGAFPGAVSAARDSASLHGRAGLPGDAADTVGDAVPEPGTLAILSVGLAGLIVSSRKKG